ncbi:MAG: hypothetical protein FD126_3326, partial [Elusimicrobia bacterium]
VRMGELMLFGPAEEMFLELAPVLALFALPSVMFVFTVLLDRRPRLDRKRLPLRIGAQV